MIVIDFVTTPAVSPDKRNFYRQVLLRELANITLQQWGMCGVEISNLYGCGSTDSDASFLERNRLFTELGEPEPRPVNFELPDVLHSDFHVLQPYQEAFAEHEHQ